MKILVTNNTLANLGGSETYTYALIKELSKRKDIQLDAFSQHIGLVGNKLKSEGISVINNIKDEYDLILASHTSTTQLITEFGGKKIQTCHGVFLPLEQPFPGMDKYVSITKEVYDHLSNKGFESTIIYNGIDCDRFKPINPLNKKLKNVLSLVQNEDLNLLLAEVCKEMGYNFNRLNKFVNPVFNVEDLINQSDLVITLGRGAYESMACGRNVFVLDKRPYINKPPLGDGIITPENINNILENNCSGRYTNTIYDKEMIKNEFIKYDHRYGEFNRDFALENLNIEKQVDKYLNI